MKDTKGKESLFQKAIETAYSHDYSKALSLIDSALSLDPNNPEIIVEKSEIICELHDSIIEAIKFLDSYLNSTKTIPAESLTKINSQIAKLKHELEMEKLQPAAAESQERVNKLILYSDHYGIKFNNCKVVYFSADNRGVAAKHRIKKGEVIFEIPLDRILTLDKLYKLSPLAKKVIDSKIKFSNLFETAATCFLYEFKNGLIKTEYDAYLNSFPEDLSSYPLFFPEEDKKYFKGTILEKQVTEKLEQYRKEYAEICNKVPEISKITFENFIRYNAIIESRPFTLNVNPLEFGLIPVIDLVNYTEENIHNTLWGISHKKKLFRLMATENIKRGSEITLEYGDYTPIHFLKEFGFVPSHICYQVEDIIPKLQQTDPLLTEKQNLLKVSKESLCLPSCILWCQKQFYTDNFDIFSAYRFIAFKDKSTNELLKYFNHENKSTDYSNENKMPYIPFLSVANEIDALTLLKQELYKTFNEFPNTYEKDLKFYHENMGKMSFNLQNCMIVRLAEREALQEAIDRTSYVIEYLKTNKDDNNVEERLQKLTYTKNKKIADSFDPLPRLNFVNLDEL